MSEIFTGRTYSDPRHYTPPALADLAIRHCRLQNPRTIADFCCGSGNLLLAAKRRWPSSRLFGVDIDATAVAAAQVSCDAEMLFCSDFLAEDFAESCVRQGSPQKFDLILLNPPFSGNRRFFKHHGNFGNGTCSLPIAFVATCLGYLHERGELICILPEATLHGFVDGQVLHEIQVHFDFEVLTPPSYNLFPGVNASAYVARISHRAHRDIRREARKTHPNYSSDRWSITRGSISIPRNLRTTASAANGWIHTTSIRRGLVKQYYAMPTTQKTLRSAPVGSLLVPRVGRVRPGSFAIQNLNRPVPTSDCLLHVSFDEDGLAARVLALMVERFDEVARLYVGTGARHVTAGRLDAFLSSLELG